MLRDAARVQPSTIRTFISLLVVLGASGSVALLDAAEGALAENRVVSVPLGIGLTVVCAVAASRGLCDAVAQWCTSADIPFEITRVDTYFAAAGTAGFWLLAKEFANMGAALPAVLSMSAIAVWCAVVDQTTMRIPTSAAYTAAALALFLTVVAGFFESDVPVILRAVEGGFAMALMYLLLAWATGGGLGMGDVRLSLSLGVVLGYQGWSSVGAGLILPILVLFPVAVGTIIHRRITGSTSASREIAAGPGLVAGCALALALNG